MGDEQEMRPATHPTTMWGVLWLIFPESMRPLMGLILYLIIFVSGCLAIVAIPLLLLKVTQIQSFDKDPCWDLREVQGKTYRFNRCTGTMQHVFKEDIEAPPSPDTLPKAPTTKAP